MNETPNWSRRNFLSARGLGASAGGVLGHLFVGDDSPAEGTRVHSYWTIARRAMACEFSILIPPRFVDAWAAGETALAVIDDLEDLLTIYRADSLMSYVNANAAAGAVRVDNRLYQLLKRCAEIHAQTGGAFDPTAGTLIKAWGFFQGECRVPAEAERLEALARTGMQHVELDDAEATVRFDIAGLEFNLGSIGKGYAIDRAVARVREAHGIDCLLMQGGLSSLYALGSPGDDERGWPVGVLDPHDLSRRIATIRVKNRGMGSSGTANQYFQAGGRRYGHVIDPRSGWPADEWASVTVLAPDAATADGLSTAFFVAGLDKTAEFCQNHRDVAVLAVQKRRADQEGRPRASIVTFNLPREDVDLHPDGQAASARVLHTRV